MAHKKVRSYFEPWVPRQATARGKPFGGVKPESIPEDVFKHLMDGWERSQEQAEWVIWGSKMADPTIVVSLDGKAGVLDDRRIIAVSYNGGLPKGSINHGEIAERIADCVNATAGIADPVRFVTEARALLLALVKGEADRGDDRILPLLARCIPPEELEAFEDTNDV